MIVLCWTPLYSIIMIHVCEWGGQKIRNTCQYNEIKQNTIFSYDLSNKCITEFTHYELCKGCCYGRVIVLDMIDCTP